MKEETGLVMEASEMIDLTHMVGLVTESVVLCLSSVLLVALVTILQAYGDKYKGMYPSAGGLVGI